MASAMVIVGEEEEKPKQQMTVSDQKKPLKRKRATNPLLNLTAEEKSAKIEELGQELKGLIGYCKEINGNNECQRFFDEEFAGNVDSAIAVLLEESMLPLSKLTSEIFEKLKGKVGNGIKGDGGGVGSLASVKSRVLLIGQRVYYGMLNVDADLLEDDSDSTLWCWETKDLKLLPKSLRSTLKTHRRCREKIKERISAVSAMTAALKNPENSLNYQQELAKVSARLSKLLNEADMREIFDTRTGNSGSELTKKQPNQEKLLAKQLEKSKLQEEKERRKMEREKQKEDLQKEKELKRLHDEAEKEERKKEKEEIEIKKRLKRHQEEAEKDQRRKEKEEAELKKQRALQKQASVMDRFLKKAKTNAAAENYRSPSDAKCDSSPMSTKQIPDSVTQSMDSFFLMNTEMEVEDMWKLHLNSWRCLGHSIRSSKNMHWGIRKKPKTELVKELKLTTDRVLTQDDDMSSVMVDDQLVDSSVNSSLSHCSTFEQLPNSQKNVKHKQLLQFDKSHRPAFYGIWPKTSRVVRPCHPFAKDPELDYEIDSDEEWEEEEPGESLSDCEKDDSLEEGCSKEHDDDDDESEDGFFVPDGYLSENEGVDVDKATSKASAEQASEPASSEVLQSEELSRWFRQKKYLHNVTELALRKNQPLVISNFKHEKASLLLADNLTGPEKHDQMCLQALSICAFPIGPPLEISIAADGKEDQEACSSNGNVTAVASASAILESDLAQIVSVIQSCPYGMNRLVESLHDKFPSASKTQLRNKVREIAEFIDNRWQVKKEILTKLGITISPDKRSEKTRSISAFFSKRCLPPGTSVNPIEVSPTSSKKRRASSSSPPLQGSS